MGEAQAAADVYGQNKKKLSSTMPAARGYVTLRSALVSVLSASVPTCRARHTVPEGPGDVAGGFGWAHMHMYTRKRMRAENWASARAKGMRANSCRLYWVVTSFVDGSFVDGRRARKCQRVSAAVRVGE